MRKGKGKAGWRTIEHANSVASCAWILVGHRRVAPNAPLGHVDPDHRLPCLLVHLYPRMHTDIDTELTQYSSLDCSSYIYAFSPVCASFPQEYLQPNAKSSGT